MPIEKKASGNYAVRVYRCGKRVSLGTYDTEEEARSVLESAKAEYAVADDIDPFTDEYIMGTKGLSGKAAAQKRQEYNRSMGHADRMLRKLADDPETEKVANYISNLAEDERRFLNRRRARSLSLGMAREALFVRMAEEALREVMADKVEPKGYAIKPSAAPKDRIVHLLLSDLHIGAMLDPTEVPRQYSAHEEARRFAKVVAETRDYKPRYRETTKLRILVNGDIIQGMLGHDLRDGDPLTDQYAAAVYMFTQAVSTLAACFPQVDVHWQTGNHGRNKLRHPGRATSSKWDSFETLIGIAVKIACDGLKNVTFDIPKQPYSTIPVFDTHLFLTHGDTVLDVGNPGKALNMAQIDYQMAKINSSNIYGADRYAVFAIGHVHQGVHASLASGDLIINPPLVPQDGYAQSKGYHSQCGQTLWESVEGYPVGDLRVIRVGDAEDQDESLEQIIKPARFSYDP